MNKKEICDEFTLDQYGELARADGKPIYYTVRVCSRGKYITAAHIVYYLKTGRLPEKGMHIDHEDINGLNNNVDNIRQVTYKESANNRSNTLSNGGIMKGAWNISKNGDGYDIRQYIEEGRSTYIAYFLSRKEAEEFKEKNENNFKLPDFGLKGTDDIV